MKGKSITRNLKEETDQEEVGFVERLNSMFEFAFFAEEVSGHTQDASGLHNRRSSTQTIGRDRNVQAATGRGKEIDRKGKRRAR
jgi:hypothetical protein